VGWLAGLLPPGCVPATRDAEIAAVAHSIKPHQSSLTLFYATRWKQQVCSAGLAVPASRNVTRMHVVLVLLRDLARETLIGCIGHLRLIRIALSRIGSPNRPWMDILVDDVRSKIHVSDEPKMSVSVHGKKQ
jgi:hypothetical protein